MAIKVALMGLGAIGRGIARCALQKHDLEIVAAIDLDPHRVGRKLSDVVDAPKIAVAAVVVNGLKWRVHAPYIAREAPKAYLVGGPLGQPPVARFKHYKRRRKHHG